MIKSAPAIPGDLPPVVLNVEPKVGAKDVDPGLREIRVTFSKIRRDKSWSWTEGTVYAFPKLDGNIHYEYDQRTCVMPVKLEAWQDLRAGDQFGAAFGTSETSTDVRPCRIFWSFTRRRQSRQATFAPASTGFKRCGT